MLKLLFKKYRPFFKYAVAGLIIYYLLISLLIYFERADNKSGIDDYFTAVWYSLVTFTTVGYGDYVPLTKEGKIIGIVFILIAATFFGLFIGKLSTIMADLAENRKLGYSGTNMKGHVVIFDWNPMTQTVVDQLLGVNKSVAIITDNRDHIDSIRDRYSNERIYVLLCDYDNYELMKKANISSSSMVFCNIIDDTKKLVLILNLKKVFPKLSFVINLNNPSLKDTFIAAGVTFVVSQHEVGAKLLASYIFEPDVAAYSEEIMSFASGPDDYDIKEYKVLNSNPYVGQTYGDIFFHLKKNYNCILIGMSKIGMEGVKKLYKNPPDNTMISPGDYLIMISNLISAKNIEKMFGVEEGVN